MSVLHDLGRGDHPHRWMLSALLGTMVVLIGLGNVPIRAQEASSATEAVAESEATNSLWQRVVDRYQVVVLSRGLLLEPLDEGVELLTIEVIDNHVAIGGETVTESELRDRIGDASAEVVLELAAMDPSARRVMFEGGEASAAVAEATVESEDHGGESWSEEEAADESEPDRRYSDSQVSVGNRLTIEEDEIAKEALVFGGPLNVRGKVVGDAVAVGGSVTVSGEVTGDVASVGGDVTIEPGAEVLGDAVSVGGEVEIDPTAKVRGQIIEVPFGPNLRFGAWPSVVFGGPHKWKGDDYSFHLSPWGVATDFMWGAFRLILLSLLACLIMLIARQPLERVKAKAVAEPWKSGLAGLLVQILTAPLLVLVILILVVSIIGIPLLLLVPFIILGLILIAFLGFSGVALGVGELLQKRFGWKLASPYVVLLLGVLTIQVWSIIADLLDFGWGPIWFFAVMFGVFGVLIKYIAWTIGLGAAVLSRFGTADRWGGRGQLPPAPLPPTDPEPAYRPPSGPRDPREPSVLSESDFADDGAAPRVQSPDHSDSIGGDDEPGSTGGS